MEMEQQSNEQLSKVGELVNDIKFAMMTTENQDGELTSRPMTTLQMDSEGNCWFFTARSSHKVGDLQQNLHVNLSYARIDKQDYLSVTGTAELVADKAKMQALWTPWIKPWFPEGLDDPDLALLKVRIESAEYWDAPGSQAKRLYGLVKGMMTGKTDSLGTNQSIRVQ